jgi:inositol transport system substrate-binding protein
MKRLLLAFAASALMMSSAMAQNIGVSMAYFDDNFLTILREAMQARANEAGVKIQFQDAQGDIGRQISQLQNFISQKVDAMVINPVDTAATPRMTKLAVESGIPMVYVNRQPETENLPDGVAYVGSDEHLSGTMEAEAMAKLMNNKGNIAIMIGELSTSAARLRTEGVEKVVAEHPDMKIVEKQPADFQRTKAVDLMNNWLVSGVSIDGIAANNDEMAIGAIIALQQAGKDPKELVIGGIDATPDALVEMKRGNLDVTVFQDGKGQGRAVIDTALRMIKGEKLETPFVFVPWQLVTQDNYKEFLGK